MSGVVRKRRGGEKLAHEGRIMVPKVMIVDNSGSQTTVDTMFSSPPPMKNSEENGSLRFTNGFSYNSNGRKLRDTDDDSFGEKIELEDLVPLLEDEENGRDENESPREKSITTSEESAWVIASQVCFPYLIAG